MSLYPNAPIISQLSPRLGFAYQLGGQAVLHFSYGHFSKCHPCMQCTKTIVSWLIQIILLPEWEHIA